MNPTPAPEEIIFTAALVLPEVERTAHLDSACGGDAALRGRVEALLRAHESAASLLQGSPGQAARTMFTRPPAGEQPGALIGRYKLLQKIGEGGCGVVYMAEQEEPVRRRVALKVIKLGMDTKEVVARFEAERQALALMDHPNIARVFDGGTTANGRPYFVMELVRGVPITRYCDENNLPTQRRLELFAAVCQAVQHAHQKGIIHRDLKPSNVLVTENDGVPVPKVIDFGIAKATQGRLTDATLFTAFEQFIGTPAYMSPEQAAMTSLDVDTRSDIYSLGVLLYELLTGRPPFEPYELAQAGFDEMRRRIREVEPPRPSTRLSTLTDLDRNTVAKMRGAAPAELTATLSGDLDWIVMRCLEKDRTRRYETASALVLDLQHYRDDQPVAARPPSTLYRVQKLVARNKLAVGATVVVTLALIVGLVASTLAYFNEKAAHQFAVETSQALQKAMAGAEETQSKNGDTLRQEAEKGVYALQIMQALVSSAATANLPAADKARILQLVDATVERLRREPQIRPATKQQLFDSAGDLYLAFGEFDRAEKAYRQVLAIRRTIMGADHPDTAAAQKKLDEVLKLQGPLAATTETRPAPPAARRTRLYDGRVALRLARELRLQGRYAEADAELHKALEAFRREFGPAPDSNILNEMARLHLETGELRGPKALALHELEVERGANGWFRYGFLAGLGISTARGSFAAHTLLGLAALREGDRAEAVQQLLRSANGIVNNPLMFRGDFIFGAPEIRLAAELLAAKETTAVLEFLQRIRRSYVNDLGARGSSPFSNFDWEDYYNHSARGRVLAEELDGWRQEILTGHTPAAWQRLLEADQPAIEPPAVRLASMEPLLAALPRPPAVGFPSFLLCLGWLAVGLGTRSRLASHLPASANKTLLVLAAGRILAGVLFAGTFLLEGFYPSGLLIFVLTLIGWRLLWDFVRTLAPVVATRREAAFFHALFWTAALIPVVARTLNYLSKSNWTQVVFAIGALLTCVLVLALLFAVLATLGGWRIWKWKPEGDLRRAKIALLASTPLLVLYAFACLAMPLVQENHPDMAVFLLWADALIPWVLLPGFFKITRQATAS